MKTSVDSIAALTAEADRLLAIGAPVLPDHPVKKYPAGFSGWETMVFTREEIVKKIASGWGIGMRMDAHREGVDLDVKHWDGPARDELRQLYEALVEEASPGLLTRLLIEATPSGGRHYVYTCSAAERNQKLAERPASADEQANDPDVRSYTLIETRGKGGQFMIAPSPGYTLLQGDWAALPTITLAERTILLDCARAFQRLLTPQARINTTGELRSARDRHDLPSGEEIADLYNQQYGDEALPLLEQNGWTVETMRGQALHLRRPGKRAGTGATFGHVAPNWLFVFSSNAQPFEPDHGYSPFAINALLEHGGDFRAATKAAAERLGVDYASNPQQPRFVDGVPHCPNCDKSLVERGGGWWKCETPVQGRQTCFWWQGQDFAVPQLDETTEEGGLPLLLHASNLDAIPPTTWLIPGIMAKNKLSQIFAPPGSGKSLLTLDQALCIAQKAPVVYVAAEAVEEYRERVAAWRAQHQRNEGQLYFWTRPLILRDPNNVDGFIAAIRSLHPAAIIIDPLASCMVGLEESSTGDMTIAVTALNRIRFATQAAVHIVHHTGWNEAHERGSSALRGACRVVMKLSADDSGLLTLSSAKDNNGKPFDERFFRLLPVGDSVVPLATAKISTRGAPLSPKQRAVIEALNLLHFRSGASFTQLFEHLDVPKSTLNKSIDKLLSEGYIEAEGTTRSKVYLLTDKGRDVLRTQQFSTMIRAGEVVHQVSELEVNWEVNYSEQSEFTASQSGVHLVHSKTSGVHQGSEQVVHPSSPAHGENPALVHPSSPVVHSEFTPQFTSSPHAPPLRGVGSEQENNEQRNSATFAAIQSQPSIYHRVADAIKAGRIDDAETLMASKPLIDFSIEREQIAALRQRSTA
jgi:DNA-binding MarR family transcriptional regulator